MLELDPRIIRVGVEIDGQLKMYDDLAVVATGTKYANAIQNEVEVRIANLDKATRDYLLTETSPLNMRRAPKRIVVDAGRASYGTSRIIVGDIITSSISQPPDIWLTLKGLTGNFYNGQVVSRSQSPVASVASISQQLANDLGVNLNFQATDKNVSNYSFSGGMLKQVNKINDMGDYAAYVDDQTLVVKDKRVPLAGEVKILNIDSGMVGVPEISVYGVKVKFLLDNVTKLGGAITVQSVLNPVVNGTYCIYKLSFEIASRDTPFYYVAEGYKI
jgi:hypothetical protein